MKRWLVHGTIAGYLLALSWGICAHTLKYKHDTHPGMYFLVWDMFCGWAAFSSRLHLVAEGESGRYYELSPAPWGEFKPFGRLGRRHYDVMGIHAPRMAVNTLAHTRHEPITRIFVIEESWAKKYNIPDKVWEAHFKSPKPEPYCYYQVLKVAASDGTLTHCGTNWLNKQVERCIADNPRLRSDFARGQPLIAPSIDSSQEGNLPIRLLDPRALTPPGALLGG